MSDGRATASLAAFSISVVDVSNGGATLSWTPPTQNTDGTSLTNLAGYRIAYGTSSTALTQTVQVANPGVSSYTISNLSPGTYYFAVRAYTSSGHRERELERVRRRSCSNEIVRHNATLFAQGRARLNRRRSELPVAVFCLSTCVREGHSADAAILAELCEF